ncbi:T-complex protein 1 subunit alpha [Eumeta japonica]|uniref:T-complex protein 1 subunit alpha n=1 Tax=Eumeta variegata TaxID=151549 RepID=A0A4C2AEG4_EUMVA|nr:T-complex protein 1 subunit alpha [Eumeta japonica]
MAHDGQPIILCLVACDDGCPSARTAASIILRGPTDAYCDEMERSAHDALCSVRRVLEGGRVVPGGGAVEAALSIYLENFATTLVEHVNLKWVGLDLVEGSLRDNLTACSRTSHIQNQISKIATKQLITILIDDMIKLDPEQKGKMMNNGVDKVGMTEFVRYADFGHGTAVHVLNQRTPTNQVVHPLYFRPTPETGGVSAAATPEFRGALFPAPVNVGAQLPRPYL